MVRKYAFLAVTAISLAACADETTSPEAAPAAAVAVSAAQATDLSAVTRAIPSFGGLYVDDFGRPTVYLTNMGEAGRARGALSAFAEANGRSEHDIQFVQAKYRASELNVWYERSWPEVMAQAGTVFSDVDEAHNRLLFGVEHAGLATAVSAIMRARGVPADAYTVQVVEPMRNLATLRDVVNPKVGGLQIHFGNYLCTLGFNVTANNVPSFVTNSHCTNTQGGVEGTVYYQPTSTAAPTSIAVEVADPKYTKGGVCPRGKKCRYSDSSRAEYRNNTAFDLGGIASTSGSNLTITGTHNITAEADANRTPVAVGAVVSKTGRTTGTSTGQVTNTCVNTSVQGSQIMQLCQTFVAAAVGSGDSGSPVYSGSGSVTLVGILWGGGTNTFAFSPLRSIKDELGNFTAH
ncbi:MAG TPA: hypothetical protein VFO52_11160 [Longimicrobiales bacterium]|nr:hypothetical protein [Longimicrobiales bacterium]